MKIPIDEDGFEILDKFSYVYKRDVFRKGSNYYKFKSSCVVCGSAYLTRTSYNSSYCCAGCVCKDIDYINKMRLLSTGRIKTKQECEAIARRMSKGDVVKLNIPLYSTFCDKLSIVEEIQTDLQDSRILNVRCFYCKEWFRPTRVNCDNRVQFILGHTDRESRFYCSDKCKDLCSIFHKKYYPKGKNPRKHRNNSNYSESSLRVWSKIILEKYTNVCELCGGVASTAHHIIPKKVDACRALDSDNGLACCSVCHNKIHSNDDDCSYSSLSKL